MTALSLQPVQCDRCLSLIVLAAKRSTIGAREPHEANWVARPIRGAYRHAPARLLAKLGKQGTPQQERLERKFLRLERDVCSR